MSIDFGPIPAPNSPIQDYFERKYKTPSSNVSPAIPLSPKVERGIEEQLTRALNELAKEQAVTSQIVGASPGADKGTPLNVLPERLGSLAASTGYTAPSGGLLKRRSLMTSSAAHQSGLRRPSR